MKLALSAAFALLLTATLAQPEAQACGMYRPPEMESPSKLIAKAKRFEKKSEPHAAARVYSRLMYHPKARLGRRVWAGMQAAHLYESVGDQSSALAFYQAVVDLDGKYGPALLGLGLAQLDVDAGSAAMNLDSALQAYKMSRADLRSAHIGLAVANARIGELELSATHEQSARRLGASRANLAMIQQEVASYQAKREAEEAAEAAAEAAEAAAEAAEAAAASAQTISASIATARLVSIEANPTVAHNASRAMLRK